jgi:hypothetical protein
MKRIPKFNDKKVLLVEGDEDKRVIPELVEKSSGIAWEIEDTTIVGIRVLGSKAELLDTAGIEGEFKGSNVRVLGILIDADEDANACWQSIRDTIQPHYPNLPTDLPSTGLIVTAPDQPKFGLWVMPDNTNRGMLETFLLHLRPTSPLLELSTQVLQMAKEKGAAFKEVHTDKAQIHTWLAWQDPPGRQMHNAIQEKMLTEKSQLLTDFLNWFCTLYDLKPQ